MVRRFLPSFSSCSTKLSIRLYNQTMKIMMMMMMLKMRIMEEMIIKVKKQDDYGGDDDMKIIMIMNMNIRMKRNYLTT